MTQRGSILVCILPDLQENLLHHYITNAASFAKQVGADVHLLNPRSIQKPLDAVIRGITPSAPQAINIVSHSAPDSWPPEAVQEALKLYSSDLIVVPSGSATADNGFGPRIRKELLERMEVPVLVLSPLVDLATAPIDSLLVPMSGEIRISSALAFGLKLASRIHVPVDLVHVVIEGTGPGAPLETVGDQPQHECRELLDRVLAEGSPFSDIKERAQVRSLYQVHGAPAAEILKASKRSPSCAIVAQWRGSLIRGRAQTLKDLFQENARPVFLVKAKLDPKSTLKIGSENQAA